MGFTRWLSQLSLMIVRQLTRWPLRAGLTVLGLALSVGILVGSMFAYDAIDQMIDVTFFQAERADATLILGEIENRSAVDEAARLPGVLRAEPVRRVAVRLHAGPRTERTALQGRLPDTDLSRLLDDELDPIAVPETGLLLPRKLAELLDVGLGDRVLVEVLEGRRPTLELPVTALAGGYVGIEASMDFDALNRALRDPPVVSSVHLLIDPGARPAFYQKVKELPTVASLILWDISRRNLLETVGRNILVMTSFYTAFASLIALGVVYNSARIALSERGRELASLRVLGFTKAEVSWILLGELGVLTLASIPLGWLLPLIEIGDPRDLEIVVDLLSTDAVKVEPGAAATVEAWGGGEILNARVRKIEPAGFTKVSALGIEEQRVNVIVDFADPPERWRALGHGYRIEARITVWRGQHLLLIPLSALFREGDDWAVFVVDDGRARLRRVKIGHRSDLEAEVIEGMDLGEQVVLHPSDRVHDGVRIFPRTTAILAQ